MPAISAMRPSQVKNHNSSNGQNKGGQSGQRPKAEFSWSTRFTNSLPDLPYDGKFLQCPFVPISRFVTYVETDFERNFKGQTMCDMDVGVKIDLVDPEAYVPDSMVELHPSDQKLLEDESASSIQKLKRSAQHAKSVPFMRRTEYISSEFNRFGTGADRQETKVGYNLLKNMDPNEIVYRDRESQIKAIEKTFEDVKKPITNHYSKKNVTAVEEFSVFPDFDLWKYPFAQVIFDADPAYEGVPENLRKTAMENGMLSGLEGSDVGYFVPKVETIQKFLEDGEANRPYTEDEIYEFPLNREYTWQVRNKTFKNFEDDYVLYRNGDKFYYNELETRVKLNRKRRPAGVPKRNAEMHVTFRDPTDVEIASIEERMKKLMRPYDEEEEEAAPAHDSDAEPEKAVDKSDDDKGNKSSDDDDDNDNKKGSDDDKKSSKSSSSSDGSKSSSSDSDSD